MKNKSWQDNYEMRVCDWNLSGDQDFTPPDFRVMPLPEGFKDFLRPYIHPLLISIHEPFLSRRFPLELPAKYQLVWGARGGGTPFLSYKVRKYLNPRRCRMLVLGIGFGPELQYWAKLAPAYLAGTEILNYCRAWDILKEYYRAIQLDFHRTSGSCLSMFPDESFDLVTSTATLEHVQDMPLLLSEVTRVLKKEGIGAFSFSPLYYTFGGDHFSGNEDFRNGFNHVLLDEKEYRAYLDSIPYRENGLADGRIWIKQGLFSYMRPVEYVHSFQKQFEILFLRVHLSPKAEGFRKEFPELYQRMTAKRALSWTEPLVSGMEVFIKKKSD